MRRRIFLFLRRHGGQSMIEFALVAPLLFMVMFGIVEFGNAWMQNNTATSAAREAVRIYAVDGNNPPSQITARARALAILQAANINTVNANITFTPPTLIGTTRMVSVTVTFPYQSLVGGFIPGINGIPLQGQTTMRYEN